MLRRATRNQSRARFDTSRGSITTYITNEDGTALLLNFLKVLRDADAGALCLIDGRSFYLKANEQQNVQRLDGSFWLGEIVRRVDGLAADGSKLIIILLTNINERGYPWD